jgi:hypothetical protein
MNVIKGAVNTLIVCWADAPSKLQENHPELTQEMLEAWCLIFPNCGLYPATAAASLAPSASTSQSGQPRHHHHSSLEETTTVYGSTGPIAV